MENSEFIHTHNLGYIYLGPVSLNSPIFFILFGKQLWVIISHFDSVTESLVMRLGSQDQPSICWDMNQEPLSPNTLGIKPDH